MKKWFILLYMSIVSVASGQVINIDTNTNLPSTVYYCNGEKFNLKLDAQAQSTGDYEVKKINNFNIANGYQLVPFVNKVANNHFSRPIDLGFTFSFYDKDYTKVVVGSNGRLIFGEGQDFENLYQDQYVDKVYSGYANPNKKLPRIIYNQVDNNDPSKTFNFAQIFAGFTDLGYYNTGDYDRVQYGKTTYQGKNGIIISFTEIIELQSNYQRKFSAQILILEDNTFIVKVIKVKGQNAILGVQNQDATKYRVEQPVFNNEDWASQGSEAYAFTPNQSLTPEVKWYVDGVLKSSGTEYSNYQPTNNEEVLKAQVIFKDDLGNQVGQPQDFEHTFKKLDQYKPIIKSPQYGTCGNPAVLEADNYQSDFTYEWYKVGDTQSIGTGPSIQVGNGKYIVKIKSTYQNCEAVSDEVEVNINSIIPAITFKDKNFKLCDNNSLGKKTVTINQIAGYPLGADYDVKFYHNGTEVNAFELTSGKTENFEIKVETKSGIVPSCNAEASFSISYLAFPENNKTYTEKLCFEIIDYDLKNFETTHFNGKGYQFEYSLDGGVTYQNLNSINPKTNQNIKVKISHPDFSCISVINLKFDFYDEVKVMPITPFPAHCSSMVEYFNLEKTKQELEYNSDIKATFYDENGAEITNLKYRGGGTITIKIENTATGCEAATKATLKLVVYSKPKTYDNLIEDKTTSCGSSVYNLTITDINKFIQNPKNWDGSFVIKYFDQNGQQLSQPEYENYDVSVNGTPYAELYFNITGNDECKDTINYNLVSNPKPRATASEILVCSETTYALDNFKTKAVSNPANYEFFDENMNPLTSDLSWSALPYAVKFYIKDKTSGCLSDLQQVVFKQNAPTPVNNKIDDFVKCDTDFDGLTTFNLNDWKSQITSDTNANLTFYQDAAHTVEIKNPSNYTNQSAEETIYGIAINPNLCPTDFSFKIKVNTSIPAQIIGKLNPCYGEILNLKVDNASDYQSVEWQLPNGSKVTNAKLMYNYEDIQWGNYTIVATSPNGCKVTEIVMVSNEHQPKIIAIETSDNKIEVAASGGVPPYTYLFNGVEQSSPILMNPKKSVYQIQVKSSTGCLGEPKMVYFLKFNNVITPNGDGKNDVWQVDYLDQMSEVNLVITDRYGKTVFEAQSGQPLTWDGKVKGRPLPSATYWYVVQWLDPATNRRQSRQGWILLKNY